MIRQRHRRGYAILSMLICLVIIFVLTQSYFSVDTPGGTMWVVSQQDRARAAVAAINFRSAEAEYIMRSDGRQLPIAQQRQEMENLARYSKDGRFFVDDRQQLRLTTMIETRRFSDVYKVAKVR